MDNFPKKSIIRIGACLNVEKNGICCVFCKIVSGEFSSHKIYEDEKVLAILDLSQATKGHTLVMPKKHYENISNRAWDHIPLSCGDHRASCPVFK